MGDCNLPEQHILLLPKGANNPFTGEKSNTFYRSFLEHLEATDQIGARFGQFIAEDFNDRHAIYFATPGHDTGASTDPNIVVTNVDGVFSSNREVLDARNAQQDGVTAEAVERDAREITLTIDLQGKNRQEYLDIRRRLSCFLSNDLATIFPSALPNPWTYIYREPCGAYNMIDVFPDGQFVSPQTLNTDSEMNYRELTLRFFAPNPNIRRDATCLDIVDQQAGLPVLLADILTNFNGLLQTGIIGQQVDQFTYNACVRGCFELVLDTIAPAADIQRIGIVATEQTAFGGTQQIFGFAQPDYPNAVVGGFDNVDELRLNTCKQIYTVGALQAPRYAFEATTSASWADMRMIPGYYIAIFLETTAGTEIVNGSFCFYNLEEGF
jgi:hypothetical protein